MAPVLDIATEGEWVAAWTSCAPGTVIVIDFWADWAEPCVAMDALFRQLAPKLSSGVRCWRVAAEPCAAAAESFQVEAVPTFLCVKVKEGKRAFEFVGPRVDGADPAALSAAFDVWAKQDSSSSASSAGSASGSLEDRLKVLIRSSDVMLFMKGNPEAPQCGFSRKIVGLLNDVGAKFGSFDILSDEEVRQGLKTFSNWPTFPQLYVDGTLVGGLDIVQQLKEDGELADVVKVGAQPMDLNTKLQKLIESAPVMLFMKGSPEAPQCGFSRQTVELLQRNNVKFGSFNILADEEVRQGLKTYSNWPTFPQIYAKGKLVGGLDIVKELEAEGELQDALL